MNHKKYIKILLFLILIIGIFIIGLLIGSKIPNFFKKKILVSSDSFIIREHEKKFKFINPLLAVGDFPSLHNFKPLENKIATFINESKQTNKINSAAVYFRDFNTGQWLGVNEDEKFSPASIYKLILMIIYLKNAEEDPSLLLTKVIYQGNLENTSQQDEFSSSSPKIEISKTYEITEIIRRMIVYSDNDAKDILYSLIAPEVKNEVFVDLGLPVLDFNDSGDTMSTKSLGLFFRILYNASYLSRNMSEAALELLSQTTFKEGIVATIPPSINVAHKYGSRTFVTADNQIVGKQLHDCGIVYHPNHPYFLCVMTKGKNSQDLKEIIQQISNLIYLDVDSDYSNN